jgi:preprotein translocase subunit YajC
LGSLIIIVAMFALLWFLLIRPQRARQQQQERLIDSVDVGDEILTSGGIYATVRGVDDEANELHVEIAPGIEVRMDRRAVGTIVRKDEDEDENEAEEDDDEAESEGGAELEGSAEEVRQRSLAAAEAEIREESVNPVEDSVNDARNENAATAAERDRR